MPRSIEMRLRDILEACGKIRKFVAGMNRSDFSTDARTLDAVLRNLEVIGEATKALPSDFRKRHAHVDWRRIAGLRDIVIHDYAGVDLDIIWDIVQNKLPEFQSQVAGIAETNE